jgi:hypothetical protein
MFDHINKILYKPKESNFTHIEGEFQPYLIQRWCSMHSPQIANLINETSNKVWTIMDSNQMWYDYLNVVIPKVQYKKISYIKKKKEESKKDSKEAIQIVANSLEISVREVNQYVETFNLLIPYGKKHSKQT